jgi:hypothetical protein
VTVEPKDPFNPISEEVRDRRRLRIRILIVVVAVLAVTGVGVAITLIVQNNSRINQHNSLICPGLTDTTGAGFKLSMMDGECIGVSDGNYVFNSAYADVEAKVAKENADIASKPAVTVALLNPLTPDDSSALTPDDIRDQLEGAFVAQHRANSAIPVNSTAPHIRLVLANEGGHEKQWRAVVDQLILMKQDPAPLVAVTGMGISTVETRDGARKLSASQIPMVAAITTADDLNYGTIPGFMRVSPSNADYVASLKPYLTSNHLDSAIVVYDGNSDRPDTGDLFTRSLRDDMNAQLGEYIKFQALNFTGATDPRDASPDIFDNITPNLCAASEQQKSPLKAILYAGREIDLKAFLKSLENRSCDRNPLTLVTGGSDLGVLNNQKEILHKKNITVVYAAATDANWVNAKTDVPTHFNDFLKEFHDQGFPDAHLLSGGAISTHDAVITATKAIGLTASHVQSENVLNQLKNLSGCYTVPGAGGDLSFSYRDSKTSDPIGKPVPVLQIPSDGPYPSQAGSVYITSATTQNLSC